MVTAAVKTFNASNTDLMEIVIPPPVAEDGELAELYLNVEFQRASQNPAEKKPLQVAVCTGGKYGALSLGFWYLPNECQVLPGQNVDVFKEKLEASIKASAAAFEAAESVAANNESNFAKQLQMLEKRALLHGGCAQSLQKSTECIVNAFSVATGFMPKFYVNQHMPWKDRSNVLDTEMFFRLKC